MANEEHIFSDDLSKESQEISEKKKKILDSGSTAASAHSHNDESQVLAAISMSNGMVEFDMEGIVLNANTLFLEMVGYSLEEIKNRHHSTFCHPEYANSDEYKAFWAKLNKGEFDRDVYKNINSKGEEIWLEGTYTPIKDERGKLLKVVKLVQDVSHRRWQNSENRAKLAAINTSNASVEFDIEGNILSANEKFLKLMGYTLEEIKGKHHSIFCEKSYVASTEYEAFWMKLAQGVHDEGEHKHITKTGREVWLNATYNPIFDLDGKAVKVIQYATDITDQISLQIDSINTKNELESRINAFNTAALMSETDLHGTITFVNDKFCEVSGFTKEELIGQPHNIVRHPSTPKEVFKELWETIQSGKIFQAEYRNRKKGGGHYWIKATIAPVLDDNGKPVKYIGIRFDITEQKEQELAALRARTELDSRVNAFNTAALMSETDIYGTITFVNDKFCEVAGYTKEELIGQPHNIVRHPSTPKSVFKELWETIKSGKIFQATYRNKKKDGGYYWINATIAPVLDEDGKPIKYIGIRFDITQQKDQELEFKGKLDGIGETSAMVEFDMDANVLNANDKFLETSGYSFEELKSMNHKDFWTKEQANGPEFKKFWEKLNLGEAHMGTYKRITKEGKEIWLEATYNPIQDIDGNYYKVVKFATDATERRLRNSENRGKLAAISESNLVVEFDLDGHVIYANDHFLNEMGYTEEELYGKHHRSVVKPDYAASQEYKEFWAKLKRGEFDKGTYKRVKKNGEEVWLEATYNPIMDDEGNFIKVVKYAQNVTARRLANSENRGKLAAINQSTGSIEFNLDGTIIKANDNFLKVLGYSAEEIDGWHHSMLCEPDYVNSKGYKEFWERLNRGEFISGEVRRLGKGGKEIWLQATYNPIKDYDGNIFKVVKYATDVTDFKLAFNALSEFLDELTKGNFDARIDLEKINASGDLAKMIQNNLSLRDNLKAIISEIQRVVVLAGNEGRLQERLNTEGKEGAWKDLVESINELLASISEPLLNVQEVIEALSDGDLTRKFTGKAAGEIEKMVSSLNSAMKNLNVLLRDIEQSSETVGTSSTLMQNKFEKMQENTTGVIAAIRQISEGMQEQVARTDESSRLVEGILKSSETMGEKSEIINKSAEVGMTNSQNGMEIIKTLVKNMTEISHSAKSTSGTIEVLTSRSEEISRTLNVITDIAAQTNLLALNAAIEAARAGDAGRGFAVVAEEIRKLAEDSRKSAVDIDRVVKDVQKDVTSASKAIGQMESNVNDGNQATINAEEVFDNILQSSQETLGLSKEVLSAANEQKNSIGSIAKNIERIVAVSEETAQGTEEVSAAAEDLNKAMKEVGGAAGSVSDVSEKLKEGISRFKLDE